MKEFDPSSDFVARVMKKVYTYEEETKKMEEPFVQRFLSSQAVRFAFSAGAMLLGVANLLRLYFTVLAPATCR